MVDSANRDTSKQSSARHAAGTRPPERSLLRAALEDLPSQSELPDLWQVVYAVLGIAATAFYLSSWYTWPDLTLPLKLFFLAVFVLTLRMWTVPVILFLMQIQILLLGRWFQDSFVGLGFVFWLVIPLIFVSLISRYRTLQEIHGRNSQSFLQRIKELAVQHHPGSSDALITNLRGQFRQLLRMSVMLSVCLVMAQMILNFVPMPLNRAEFDPVAEYRLTPSGFRLLTISLGLFLAWLVAWLIINELVWQRHSPSQSSLYLRSVFLDSHIRDLRAVVRRRIKQKKKQTKRVASVEDRRTESTNAADVVENPDAIQRML